VTAGGSGLIYDVAWTPTSVAVTNPRSPWGTNGGFPEGAIWDRTNRAVLYFIYGSTGNARLYQRNVVTGAETLLKDFKLDARFTSHFGGNAQYIFQLRSDRNQQRFVALALGVAGTDAPLGSVIWDKTTDAMWFMDVPGGE